jgi:hypothetical protein
MEHFSMMTIKEHLMLLNGKLYKMQYGVRTQVGNQFQLRNGGIANPDGSYQLKNAALMQLHNGECLDLNGNLYQNQNMFGRRQMMGQPKMMQNKKIGKTGATLIKTNDLERKAEKCTSHT